MSIESENIAAANSTLRQCDLQEPTTEEMRRAWEEFKRTRFFSVLMGHLEKADILLSVEGSLWGFFYNGYIAGANRGSKPCL